MFWRKVNLLTIIMDWSISTVCKRFETIVRISTIAFMVACEPVMFWISNETLPLRMPINCAMSFTCKVYQSINCYGEANRNYTTKNFLMIFHVRKKKLIAWASFFKSWMTRRTQLFSMGSQRPDALHLAFWVPTMPVLHSAVLTSPRSPAPNTLSEQVNSKKKKKGKMRTFQSIFIYLFACLYQCYWIIWLCNIHTERSNCFTILKNCPPVTAARQSPLLTFVYDVYFEALWIMIEADGFF